MLDIYHVDILALNVKSYFPPKSSKIIAKLNLLSAVVVIFTLKVKTSFDCKYSSISMFSKVILDQA